METKDEAQWEQQQQQEEEKKMMMIEWMKTAQGESPTSVPFVVLVFRFVFVVEINR